jgi:hypothetical protein
VAHNCLYRDAGCQVAGVCDLLPRVIEAATGLGAERLECQRDDRPACVFTGGWRPAPVGCRVKPASPRPADVARPGGIAAVFLLAAVPTSCSSTGCSSAPLRTRPPSWCRRPSRAGASCSRGRRHLPARAPARAPPPNALADQRAAYDATIEGWARALDLRDHETEGHGRRVADLAARLGERLGLVGAELEALRHGALLHDVGKIGVRDAVLRRRARSTSEKWAEMRQHPVQGHDLLADVAHLRVAATVVRSHHERWDGGGYPDGLAGEADPQAGARVRRGRRVRRPDERPAVPPRLAEERVLAHLRHESGRQFDPNVVTAFLDLLAHADDARPPMRGTAARHRLQRRYGRGAVTAPRPAIPTSGSRRRRYGAATGPWRSLRTRRPTTAEPSRRVSLPA